MEKGTRFLGVALLILAGLFYWNKQASDKALDKEEAEAQQAILDKEAEDKAIKDKAEAEALKAASDKEAADKLTAEEIFKSQIEADREAAIEAMEDAEKQAQFAKQREEAEKAAAIQQALADLMRIRTADVSIASYQKYVMNPLEYNPDESVQDVVVLKIPKNPSDTFYQFLLTELDSNMNKIGNQFIAGDDAMPIIGEQYYGAIDGNFVIILYAKPNTNYEAIVKVLSNAGMDNEQIVIRNKFIYSPNNIVNQKL